MTVANPIRIGIVGVGKIVRDQHLPALAADPDYRLVAAASRHGKVDGFPNFPSIEAMLDAVPELAAQGPRIERDEAGRITRVFLSARTGQGLDLLREAISEAVVAGTAGLQSQHEAPDVRLIDRWEDAPRAEDR